MAAKPSGRAPRSSVRAGAAAPTHAARRLVVVVAFDVVNFSALVEADEERVLDAWRALRQAIDPLIAARGGRIFQRLWNTSEDGIDTARLDRMRFAEHSFVFKLLFSAAPANAFPQNLLTGALQVDILPDPGDDPVRVRLMQIDIAVKDRRAGTTGWYFATYAYDRNLPGTSPWTKMVPVGLMWGNDPGGPPIEQSWINADAPAYALAEGMRRSIAWCLAHGHRI